MSERHENGDASPIQTDVEHRSSDERHYEGGPPNNTRGDNDKPDGRSYSETNLEEEDSLLKIFIVMM